jgi:hypothetical protein
MQSPHLFGICIASGATCLSPLTAVNLFVRLSSAVRGDENMGRCRFSAVLVSARYHFLHKLVYAVSGAGLSVSDQLGIGVIRGNSGITAVLFQYTVKMLYKNLKTTQQAHESKPVRLSNINAVGGIYFCYLYSSAATINPAYTVSVILP